MTKRELQWLIGGASALLMVVLGFMILSAIHTAVSDAYEDYRARRANTQRLNDRLHLLDCQRYGGNWIAEASACDWPPLNMIRNPAACERAGGAWKREYRRVGVGQLVPAGRACREPDREWWEFWR